MDRSPWTRLRFDDGLLALVAAAIALLALASILQLVLGRSRSTMDQPIVPMPAATQPP